MNTPFYLGIDPGSSGGLALLDATGKVVFATAMPETPRAILDTMAPHGRTMRAALEHVWSTPGWGHVGAFKFGGSFHGLEMALTALDIPFTLVLPKTWQKVVGVSYPKRPKSAKAKARDKNVTKRRAQELFPKIRMTHAIADALLIAEYARLDHIREVMEQS